MPNGIWIMNSEKAMGSYSVCPFSIFVNDRLIPSHSDLPHPEASEIVKTNFLIVEKEKSQRFKQKFDLVIQSNLLNTVEGDYYKFTGKPLISPVR